MKPARIHIRGHKIEIANDRPLVLIAGLCIIENERHTLQVARALKTMASSLSIPLIFKASYDKANRSSITSFRGTGIEKGLKILSAVKEELGLPVLTDVHCAHDAARAAEVADILQVPAFLCRQTDLLIACAETGLPVNVKKGQFLAPRDMFNIVKKIEHVKNRSIILTERGSSFGYNNLVTDMRSLEIMKETSYPVIFDATHSVQLPGAAGLASGGERRFIAPLARAATAVGVAGIFVEVHPNPDKALSDGPNSLALSALKKFLEPLIKIDSMVKKF